MDRHDTLLLACGSAENRAMLRSILEEGFNLLEAVNSQQAVLLLEQNIRCIAGILLDVSDPEKVNEKLLLRQETKALLENVPVIVITPDDSPEVLSKAFNLGAADVISLQYDPYAMLHRIENIAELHIHKLHLEVLVQEQADILRHSNDIMVDALSTIIEYRSVESGQHILRIRHFTKILLEEIAQCCPEYGLTDEIIRIISSASALHDVGKISIPDSILNKPGKLTAEEMEIMQAHTVTGCKILQQLGDMGNEEYLRYAHNICHYHHERWDGGGYPEGLSGDTIPICAQAVGLADVYDALTTRRVYKDAFSFDTAINMILKGECGAFSPKLLECFKHVTERYEELAKAYADGLAPEKERFDTALPAASAPSHNDSMERTWAKYQALIHYANVFLLELDLDGGMFHLIYNPYPELVSFHDVSTFGDISRLILDELVVPSQRGRMEQFIQHELTSFVDEGLRRSSYFFRFRSKACPEGEEFELTLLRINPADTTWRTLAILGRKIEAAPNLKNASAAPVAEEYAYICRNDHGFTLHQFGGNRRDLGGYTQEEIRSIFGGHLIELVIPEDREMIRQAFREQLRHGPGVQVEYRVRHKDGRILWVLNKSRVVIDGAGEEWIYTMLIDISDSRRTIDELNRKLDRYEIILAQTENVLFEWDVHADTVSFSNTWEKIFGFEPVSGQIKPALRNGSFFHPDDIVLLMEGVRNLESGSGYEMAEVRVATVWGRYLWCRFRATAIRDDMGRLCKIAGIIINIDAEKQAEQALQDRAERDALTKLLNKEAGRRHAENYFTQFPQGVNCALLIIDLDNFKQVNDRYGHLFGDAILTQAAREIKKLFRNQDILARIGGDEFMVLMRGVSDRALVESRCNRLLATFRSVFCNARYDLPLTCSVGVALSPEHGTSYYDLYHRADQALYQAKDRGKSAYVIYDSKDAALFSAKRRHTAVSNRIDSDEQPGLADSNIVQYAFRQLYSAQNVDAAVNHILDMVGRQMNVSRVYVFENSGDNRFCSNTYEWCNEGIPAQIDNLQNISYAEDIPGYRESYNEHGIFYCPDINNLPQQVYDVVAPQGIKSMLHCAILDNGVFRGYIGFDECRMVRLWTQEQIQVLTYFSEMLSVFLLKKRAQEKIAQRANDLNSILDNQNAWIYIIDPETCRLKYLNAKAQALTPEAKPGMLCHEVFMGNDSRCPGCPSGGICRSKTGCAKFYNEKFGLWVLAEATAIQWEGEASCLMTCREIPEE